MKIRLKFIAIALTACLCAVARAEAPGGVMATPATSATPATPSTPPMPPTPASPATPATPHAPSAAAAPVAPAAPPPSPSAPPAVPVHPALEGRVYQPGPFDGVEIGGAAEVRYAQGDSDWVFVAGSPEVQRTVTVDVQGGLLRIRSEGGWRFWANRRLQVQVVSRNLSRLAILGAADVLALGPVKGPKLQVHISGAGLARFDQVNMDYLGFSVSGAGDGQFAGQVRDLNLTVSGKSEFRGDNLQANRARVSISGVGNVKVWALDELTVSMAGVGNVEYWGTPRLRLSTSGPGSITPRGAKLPAP